MITPRTLLGSLAAVALVTSAGIPAAHAGGNNYNYSVTFNTPANFMGTGNGDIVFLFTPEGPNPAQAFLTAGNLSYSNDWQINPFGITFVGDASLNFFTQTVTLGNTQAQNGFSMPVTQWGTDFSLDFNYTDPPGTDPTDFSLTLQKTGQADASLFDIQFDPSGKATLLSSAGGVTITPQPGTPGFAPVPEASTTISFGLLMSLGLGGLVFSARRKTTAR